MYGFPSIDSGQAHSPQVPEMGLLWWYSIIQILKDSGLTSLQMVECYEDRYLV